MIRLAADTALYVLDDEAGLFFSESRQELYAFNASATFVWCCLEEGLSPDAIAVAYTETFGVSHEEAEPAVAAILERWQGLGYLSGLAAPASRATDLTTALGRLLASPSLRRELEHSPEGLAARLALRGAERDAFRDLEPAAADAQADALEEVRRRLRGRSAAPGEGVALGSALGAGRAWLERAVRVRRASGAEEGLRAHYRLLSSDFCVRYPSADVKARVHPAFAHLAVDAPAGVLCQLDLLEDGTRYLLLDGVVPVGPCGSPEEITPLLRGTLQHVASQASEHFLQIHAGVISDGEVATLLPGAPGSGKTTLTAAAVASPGVRYLSEEIALLQEETLSVRPMPLPLTVKPGSVGPLSALYPDLGDRPVDRREDAESVRYLPPPTAALRYDRERSHRIGRIVFPRYLPGAATALHPLSKREALERLMQECLVLPDLLDRRKVRDLVRWLRGVTCFELRMSEVGGATALLLSGDGST